MKPTTLPINYNRAISIGVVSEDANKYLVLDTLFDDFEIITPNKQTWLSELGLKAKVTPLNVSHTLEIKQILRSKKFFEYCKQDARRKFLLYSPLDPPYKVNPLRYLMNSPAIAHAYENKRYFRDEFADLIRIPEYEVRYVNQLDKAAAYAELKERYGSFVLQDEESTGSKGTYLVHNQDDYLEAVSALKRFSQGRSVVVSKFVKGMTASIQACVTKYGVFSGGVQRQIVNSKYLCNPKQMGAAKFCGGELGGTFPEIVQMQAREIASVLGSELGRHGYKGVFGVDLIITPENEVYTIEINARLTAYTYLLSEMQLAQGKIPFILLHTLELGNYNYEVVDFEALPSMMNNRRALSFMIINNSTDDDYVMPEHIPTGVYTIQDGTLKFVRAEHDAGQLRNENELLLSTRYNAGEPIKPGRRILKVTYYGKALGTADLNKKAVSIVETIKARYGIA